MKNIFVGNLDFRRGRTASAFAQYGNVERISIVTDRDTGRSRGFAFVEITNTDDGDKAMQLSTAHNWVVGRSI